MSTYVRATEAARLLGVTKPTLYAYVSRGLVERRTAVDGRTSLYERASLERLATRSRQPHPARRPTIDVQIGSAITELHDEGVTYRGHDVATLSTSYRFEQIAELLWSNRLSPERTHWSVDREALDRCRAVAAAAGAPDPLATLTLAATTLGIDRPLDSASVAARRLLTIAPSLAGGPLRGDIADRLAAAWCRRSRAGEREAVSGAISRALVLLADHELATSTLAVRVACSVRATPYAAIAAGLDVVGGSLHGAASRTARALLGEAAHEGADRAIGRRLAVGERIPGFGHTVYRSGDPRFGPLLDAVRRIPDAQDRMAVVDAVLTEAGQRLGHLPNVDLALGALLFVADLPAEAPIFAIARIAGWAAHYDEELGERPVRFRGLATRR